MTEVNITQSLNNVLSFKTVSYKTVTVILIGGIQGHVPH